MSRKAIGNARLVGVLVVMLCLVLLVKKGVAEPVPVSLPDCDGTIVGLAAPGMCGTAFNCVAEAGEGECNIGTCLTRYPYEPDCTIGGSSSEKCATTQVVCTLRWWCRYNAPEVGPPYCGCSNTPYLTTGGTQNKTTQPKGGFVDCIDKSKG